MKFIVTQVLVTEPIREKDNYKIWGWIVNAKVDGIEHSGLKLGYAGKTGIDLVINKEYEVSYNDEYKNYKLIINKPSGGTGFTPYKQYISYTLKEYDDLWDHAYEYMHKKIPLNIDNSSGFRELLSTYIISATNKGIKVLSTPVVNIPAKESEDHSHDFYEAIPVMPETKVGILSAIKDHIAKHPNLSDDWINDWSKCGGLDKVTLDTMQIFYKLYVLEQ